MKRHSQNCDLEVYSGCSEVSTLKLGKMGDNDQLEISTSNNDSRDKEVEESMGYFWKQNGQDIKIDSMEDEG